MSVRKQDTTRPPERRSAGTIGGHRQPLSWPSERPFRILSIDGGGIKGIFPASVLSAFETEFCPGNSAGEYFDLITGTSTGGIIALGLSLGLPSNVILELYMEHGASIFPPSRLPRPVAKVVRGFGRVGRYSYKRAPLKAALEDVFDNRTLGDAERRLCIPSFEGTYGEVFVFKTPHHPDFKLDWSQRMVDVAMATAAAPTFFKTLKMGRQVFADGGVWANNPVMIGLVDALSTHNLDRRQVQILSLSCGDLDIPFTKGQRTAGGLWHWREIIKSAMHLASQNSTGQAGLLIGRDQLVRIEPPPVVSAIEMDDFEAASSIIPALAAEAARSNFDAVRPFFSAKAALAPAFNGPRQGHAPVLNFA